ncbi:MAG TPA: cytidylate kinase-like family protein [Mycobacteriales bacterium]|jgi:hypothetical protein|nr:cytidylate kinase-like family protein [Mycobacteriales bacterium]
MLTVTLSAAYGAGGSYVGPRLAEQLGLRFLDRAIPAAVAGQLGVELAEAVAHDGRSEHGFGRLLTAIGRVPSATLGGLTGFLPPDQLTDETVFAEHTARLLREVADDTGAVILGRAAAVVLAGRPQVLHVRMSGPPEARAKQASRLRGVDLDTTRTRLRDNDAAREAYVKNLYGRDPRDPALYHVVLDSTALTLDTCVNLLVTAARSIAV